jgi:proteasome activator subunit 4
MAASLPTFVLDWVTSLFRRVLALYENLPEEGGKKNTTGGKPEESVLKSIKSMLDIVCLHLSDQLFDLVLNLVFNYATTNAKSNAVRAFGQLVASLARVKPKETIAKFLPYCLSQVEEELRNGASSIRTTQSHLAVPSDTTLHWSTFVSCHVPFGADSSPSKTWPSSAVVWDMEALRWVRCRDH